LRQITRRQGDRFLSLVSVQPGVPDDLWRDNLLVVLERHGGHMTNAAEALGITRKTLWDKLRSLGVKAKGES
jgi:transcriptional regulator of acetoin/glycerol metabolism